VSALRTLTIAAPVAACQPGRSLDLTGVGSGQPLSRAGASPTESGPPALVDSATGHARTARSVRASMHESKRGLLAPVW
jgi:hypothetical protein